MASLEESCLSTHQARCLGELMGCEEETAAPGGESHLLIHLQNLRFHLGLPLGCG